MLKYSILLYLLSCHIFSALSQTNEKFNFLKAGDKAPIFTTIDFNRDSVSMEELLKKGKVVLVFYRGAWCPYCNKHMSHLQDSLQFILDKGVSVVTITPEIESSIEKTIHKTKATFHIVHDSLYTIMNLYGVAFKVNEATIKKYKLFGIDLEEANGNSDNILPVPATFIISQNGDIEYIHFDENYKIRLSVAAILEKL